MSINENRSKLAGEGRVLEHDSKIKQTWTRDGTVYIKLNDDSIMRITTEKGLVDLQNSLGFREWYFRFE